MNLNKMEVSGRVNRSLGEWARAPTILETKRSRELSPHKNRAADREREPEPREAAEREPQSA